jgi:mono/diheme cytochrome c family protein
MRTHSVQPRGLNMARLLSVFAGLSLVFVAVLAFAPVRPYFSEWRSVQHEYNRLARQAGQSPVAVEVKQIWRPALGATDRCVTCHLGMGAAAPLAGQRLFEAHPPVPHDPREFGCTICHGGQGRATTREAAHGFVSHWDEHILDRQHLAAGCGTCHDEFPVAPRAALARGARLVESLDCLSCHRVEGRGRGSAADLTYAGLTGYRADWHADHLARHRAATTEPWTSSYGAVEDPDLAAIDSYLRTRVGAPRIVEARALALERGCLGCHKVGGRGGDEGPALDAVGRKPIGDLDFTHVEGERTLMNYTRAHLVDPSRVVPGSLMPAQTYTDEELDLLTSWVLFLRRRELPAQFLPKERLRRTVLSEPPPPLDGATAYGAYCAGCHGPDGGGRNFGNLDTRFPSIGRAGFLDVATDAFIERTLATGRPGRRMPALAASGGSLTPEETRGIIRYLRTLAPPPPSFEEVTSAASDPDAGARAYRADCATCHGESGEGTPLGSPLTAADSTLAPRALYDAIARGVPGTAMPGYSDRDATTLRGLIDHVRRLPRSPGSRAAWRLAAGDAEAGRDVYGRTCAGCHGAAGEGKLGPALSNAGFLAAATPAYVAATIARGRPGTVMPSFTRDSVAYPRLSEDQIRDAAAFVTSLRK